MSEYGNRIISVSASISLGSFLNSEPRIEHLEYDQLISRYLHHFGEESDLLLPYELFKRSPDRFVHEIFEHIYEKAIDERILQTIPFHRRVNVAPSPAELINCRIGNRIFRWPSKINPSPIYHWDLGRYYSKRLAAVLGPVVPSFVKD